MDRKENFQYKIILFWSNEDQAYIAEVPELQGCVADGNSYQEALKNAETAIKIWLEVAQESGRVIPKAKTH